MTFNSKFKNAISICLVMVTILTLFIGCGTTQQASTSNSGGELLISEKDAKDILNNPNNFAAVCEEKGYVYEKADQTLNIEKVDAFKKAYDTKAKADFIIIKRSGSASYLYALSTDGKGKYTITEYSTNAKPLSITAKSPIPLSEGVYLFGNDLNENRMPLEIGKNGKI